MEDIVTETEVIDLGFCPRCKEDWPIMTREIDGILFCWLCSFDIEEEPMERKRWVRWARGRVEEQG